MPRRRAKETNVNKARKLLYNKDTLKTEVLSTPVRSLNLRIKHSILDKCIQKALEEAREFGIKFTPTFYLSDSYGCMEGATSIALAFWDSDNLLREIVRENTDVLRDEGDILLLIKHEIGHAFCYAHKLYRLKEFRGIFSVEGHFFNTYPEDDSYRPDPWSKDFVNPDGDHYAQKHPDDDFAETFAVFIDPDERWRDRYTRRTGAFRKIQFVRRVIRYYGQKQPGNGETQKPLHMPVEEIKETVAEFLKINPRRYLLNAEGYIDGDLKCIFKLPGRIRKESAEAWRLVQRYRVFIEHAVTRQTKIKDPVPVRELVNKAFTRLKALNMVYLVEEEEKALAEITGLIMHKTLSYKVFNTFRLPVR